jgi:hypothetical protein
MLILLDDFHTDNKGTKYIIGSHIHRKFPTPDDINNNMDGHRQLTAKKEVLLFGWVNYGIEKVY